MVLFLLFVDSCENAFHLLFQHLLKLLLHGLVQIVANSELFSDISSFVSFINSETLNLILAQINVHE